MNCRYWLRSWAWIDLGTLGLHNNSWFKSLTRVIKATDMGYGDVSYAPHQWISLTKTSIVGVCKYRWCWLRAPHLLIVPHPTLKKYPHGISTMRNRWWPINTEVRLILADSAVGRCLAHWPSTRAIPTTPRSVDRGLGSPAKPVHRHRRSPDLPLASCSLIGSRGRGGFNKRTD